MKVLVTADWHIGVTQYGIIQSDGRNSRLADAEDVLCRMVRWASEMDVDLFICAGDIFHTNKPTPEEQLVFWRILNELEDSSIEYARFIIGNHDYNSKLGSVHALKLFKQIIEDGPSMKIKIFDETDWELFDPDDNPLLICYYPYGGEFPDWSVLGQFPILHASALVCHSHLEGAVVGAEPFEIKSDAATRFSQIPVHYVWAGHFHKPQILSGRPLAFYPGSPYAVDFSERLDSKGCVIVDTDSFSYEPAGFSSRRLYQIDVEGSCVLPSDCEREVRGCIVKVNIELAEGQVDTFDEKVIRETLIGWGAHSIASINLKVERSRVERDPEIKLESGLVENFERYVNKKDYGEEKELVLTRGREIIENASHGI